MPPRLFGLSISTSALPDPAPSGPIVAPSAWAMGGAGAPDWAGVSGEVTLVLRPSCSTSMSTSMPGPENKRLMMTCLVEMPILSVYTRATVDVLIRMTANAYLEIPDMGTARKYCRFEKQECFK